MNTLDKMVLIRYVDLYETYEENGEVFQEVTLQNHTMPIYLKEERITSISPFFTSTGKMYKNVSFLSYDGETIKVVGNYKKLGEFINKNKEIIGYRK